MFFIERVNDLEVYRACELGPWLWKFIFQQYISPT